MVINIVLAIKLEAEEQEEEFGTALGAMFLSAVVYYPSIFMAYIFSYNFKQFLIALFVVQSLITIALLIISKIESKKKSLTTK